MSTFRTEIFKLCKKLQAAEGSHALAEFIKNLTITRENPETGELEGSKHGNFAYVAKQSKNQFHGYLFVDENIESINKQVPFGVENLLEEERKLVEVGHRTLVKFVDLCLSDLVVKTAVVAKSINPYSLFKKVNFDISGDTLLTDEEMKPAAEAFKHGKLYQALIKSDLTKLFENVSLDDMIMLIEMTGKEIQKSYDDNSNSDIDKFSSRNINGYQNIQDVMLSVSILIFALKESLRMACNLLYEAICGDDLIVLNNDNIISIDSKSSNRVVERYKVLIQDWIFRISGDGMGSVLLIDCETMHGDKIHEFGMIIASTINFSGDMGSTTKYTFLSINEELINIHIITDFILKKDLPRLIDNRKSKLQ